MARPTFKPTPAQRRRVAIAAAAGMSHQDIAIGLKIAKMTLEKHFESELSVGAIERRLEVLEAIHKAAKKGNVSAAKAILAMQPTAAPPPLAIDDSAKLKGKKELQNETAQTAHVGTPWADIMRDAKAPH